MSASKGSKNRATQALAGLAAGTRVLIAGTTNYNGAHSVNAVSTAKEIVIAAVYVAETFTGAETAAAL